MSRADEELGITQEMLDAGANAINAYLSGRTAVDCEALAGQVLRACLAATNRRLLEEPGASA